MRKLSIVMLGLLLLPTAGLFAAAEGEMAAADAPMPITWAGVGGAGVGENTVIEQLLEEKFNVEIDTIRYHQNDREKHNLLVASGEHPDAWYVWNFHDQGLQGFVWVRGSEVAASRAARLRWSHA